MSASPTDPGPNARRQQELHRQAELNRRRRDLAARRRRRRRRVRVQAPLSMAMLALVVFGGVEVAHGRDRRESAATASAGSRRRGGGTGTQRGGATTGSAGAGATPTVSTARATSTPQANPLKTAAARRLVAGREGRVTAAVEDLRTGQEWLLNRGDRDQTASIVKADILETLLHQRGRTASGLASVENSTAEGMIEESDNDDATDLWDEIGGGAGLASYNRLVGLTQTTPGSGGYWGETLTTARDQIRLLRQLALPSRVLTAADRRYQLSLMHNIDPDEDWGVTGGVPANVSVALKNGWVPLTSYTDWEINSIGWVNGDGRDYLIAILTAHDPSEGYGIDTIEQLSADVYRSLAPTTVGHLGNDG